MSLPYRLTPESLACAGCGDGWLSHEHRGGPCTAWGCPCLGFRWLPPEPTGEDEYPGQPRPRHGRPEQ